MTTQQMLTEIVRAMNLQVSNIVIYDNKSVDFITKEKDTKLGIMRTGVKSIFDLLGNAEAMKAAYGDEIVCNKCAAVPPALPVSKMCFGCGTFRESTEKYSYISHKALDLFHEGGDAIKYLHDNLSEKENSFIIESELNTGNRVRECENCKIFPCVEKTHESQRDSILGGALKRSTFCVKEAIKRGNIVTIYGHKVVLKK